MRRSSARGNLARTVASAKVVQKRLLQPFAQHFGRMRQLSGRSSVNLVKDIIRAETARRGISYEQLAETLAELGYMTRR
jgi:ribosome-binding protein aMBF1 (putative translation factor)